MQETPAEAGASHGNPVVENSASSHLNALTGKQLKLSGVN